MAVLRKILSFIFAILAAVGKLFYMTVILVFRHLPWWKRYLRNKRDCREDYAIRKKENRKDLRKCIGLETVHIRCFT